MIDVSGLTKRYGKVSAVEDLTFSVQPGRVTGFLGPNGAGKSTTMRMIVGQDHPTSGQALIDGTPYRGLKNPLTQVGALLDAKAFHPNRSAKAHLKWIAQSNGISARRVDEVLELVGLSAVARKRAGGFSLGMGQRLGLAAALIGNPHTLILDEPVNGLDPEGIRWMRGLMQSLAAEGRTVLVSSHLLSEMAQTAQDLVVIGKGRLIANTTVEDFIRSHSQRIVVVRSDYLTEFAGALDEEHISYERARDGEGRDILRVLDVTTDDVGSLAYSVGVPLFELSEHKASLEDAFFHTTDQASEYRGQTDTEGRK